MTIEQFEEAIWEVDGLRVVVRAKANVDIGEYDRVNASNERWSVTQWLESDRLQGLQGHEIIVIGGNGEEPHGKTLLRTVRASYTA